MSRKNKYQRLDFYGTTPFFQVSMELYNSDAFQMLKPKEKLVLIDWLRMYNKVSKGDTHRLPHGMNYTWPVCDIDISEAYFIKARMKLVSVGFINFDPSIQGSSPGRPNFYKPSNQWRKYQVTEEERKRKQKLNTNKENRILEKNRRRNKFIMNMNGKNKKIPK